MGLDSIGTANSDYAFSTVSSTKEQNGCFLGRKSSVILRKRHHGFLFFLFSLVSFSCFLSFIFLFYNSLLSLFHKNASIQEQTKWKLNLKVHVVVQVKIMSVLLVILVHLMRHTW